MGLLPQYHVVILVPHLKKLNSKPARKAGELRGPHSGQTDVHFSIHQCLDGGIGSGTTNQLIDARPGAKFVGD